MNETSETSIDILDIANLHISEDNDNIDNSITIEKKINYEELFSQKKYFCLIIDEEPYMISAKILKESSPLFFGSSNEIKEDFDQELLNYLVALSTCNPPQMSKTISHLLSMSQYNELHRIYNFFQFKVDIDKMNFRLNPFYENYIDLDEEYWALQKSYSSCCKITKLTMFVDVPTPTPKKVNVFGRVSLTMKYMIDNKEKVACGMYQYKYFCHSDTKKTTLIILPLHLDKMSQISIRIHMDDDSQIYKCDMLYKNTKNEQNHRCLARWKHEIKWIQSFQINFADRRTTKKFIKRTIDYSNPANLQYV